MKRPLTCVEICAGAGGQALGLAMAGFVHVALVEYEQSYCNVLKANRRNGMSSVQTFMILTAPRMKGSICWPAAFRVPHFLLPASS